MAVSFNLPDPYEAQKQEIARRQKYAEALQQQAFQPIEAQTFGQYQAPIPAAAVLAKALQGAFGGYMAGESAREQRQLREGDVAKSQEFAAALQGAKTPEERQALALRAMGGEFGQRGQMIGAGEYQMAETRAQKEAERQFRAQEAEAARIGRAEQAEQGRALQREIAAGSQELRRLGIEQQGEIARMRETERRESEAGKLPPNVVTTYQEARLAERQAGDIADKMTRHIEDIKEGRLPLGVMNTPLYRARNALGVSSPESVRFADLQRDVDSAVNAILMAAKGTQTEGDAIRARNQILSNPNDEENVKQALANISKMSREVQGIYRGTLNQLGGKYKALEHERLPAIEAASPAGQQPAARGAPVAPTPAGGNLTAEEQRELEALRARFPRAAR